MSKMRSSEIERKRSILFSARIRFSPEVQPVRQTAIDKIVEQTLLLGEGSKGLTVDEIVQQGLMGLGGNEPSLRRFDIEQSLQRLRQKTRVYFSGPKGQERFSLKEETSREIWDTHRSTEGQLLKVTTKLFKDTNIGIAYAPAFHQCLCNIFSMLGEGYVRLILGQIKPDDVIRLSNVENAVKESCNRYKDIDSALLQSALVTFIRESDPEYDAIKWNLAQNYYVLKALGLDPTGKLLSEEIIKDAELYLDTNVMIHSLEPTAKHYKSFEALIEACRRFNVRVTICQISIDELRRVVDYHREMMPKVFAQIPDETATKIRGLFFQLYTEEMKKTGVVDFDQLFSNYINPVETMEVLYDIKLLDDNWFLDGETQARLHSMASEITAEYRSRGRRKSYYSALHDAGLLLWVSKERENTTQNKWVVTLDNGLPTLKLKGQALSKPLAITLDALLQWLSPLAISQENEDQVATIFSLAIKYLLLPQDTFFELRDFAVLAEMETSCKELPPDDVENCVRYIKANCLNLDPTNPADREKILYEVKKFFSDPSRQYKRDLDKLKSEMDSLRVKNEQLELNQRIAEGKLLQDSTTIAAFKRFPVCLIVFILLELASLFIAHEYGAGENLFQKAGNLWYVFIISTGLGVIFSWWYLGHERIRALGWPWNKLLKGKF